MVQPFSMGFIDEKHRQRRRYFLTDDGEFSAMERHGFQETIFQQIGVAFGQADPIL